MGIKDPKCDNAEDNLTTDFDPNSEIDKLMYTCLDNSTKYDPSYKFQPILTEYTIPPAYVVCKFHLQIFMKCKYQYLDLFYSLFISV